MILEDANNDIKDEKKTMEKVQEIANTIDSCIKTTMDYCDNHEDKKLPVLDVKVWIGYTTNGELKVIHEHYLKDVSTRMLIHAKSAHSITVKENVLVNEVCRILRNSSIYLTWDVIVKHVNYFVQRMQYSEYPIEMRYKVIKKAITIYDEKERKWKEEDIRFKRSKDVYKERRKRKAQKKKNWYSKEGRYEAVMFVEATEGSVLKKRVQIAAKKNKVKVKVQERSGVKIKRLLQKSDPFNKKMCQRGECILCRKKLGADCHTRGCVYQITCSECNNNNKREKYRGNTGRSMYERVNQHYYDWNRRKEDSALWKHASQYHSGEEFPTEIKVLQRCFGHPTRRMITEAVMIGELDNDEAMNNKDEYGFVKLPKITVA